MANPRVPQGTLNRVRGSIQFSANAGLNVTSPYLGREGISIAFGGDASQVIGTMTGTVTSPEVYQMVTVTMHLLKSQAFADLWKQQIETITNVGDLTVKPDSATLSDYQFVNGSILGGDPGGQNGTTPDYVVRISAYYPVNANLFNL